MSLQIPIRNIANQTLNSVLNGQNCTITILTRGGQSYLSLQLDGNFIIQNRKLTLTPVLPYTYMKSLFNGNLILINSDGNTDINPDYTKFGILQFLIFFTDADL